MGKGFVKHYKEIKPSGKYTNNLATVFFSLKLNMSIMCKKIHQKEAIIFSSQTALNNGDIAFIHAESTNQVICLHFF